MDEQAHHFIEKSTLLFIASRNAEGAMDVSPRGGQPSVVRVRPDGRLLLPDYVGNRRLDTIGNILSDPEVALLLLNRGTETYLKIAARATVSQEASDIAAFPADENRPLSVFVLAPERMEFVHSMAFRASGFWIDPSERKPPLEVLDIYARDGEWQAEGGREPVLYDAAAEDRLVQTGLRKFYGSPSLLVQRKVYKTAGPGFMGFIGAARFIVFAHESETGEIAMDLVGGSPLRPDLETNRQSLLLELEHEGSTRSATPHSAAFALVAVEPGRADSIRLNGAYREVSSRPDGRRQLSLHPEEIYFHCSASFARSRIWIDSRPVAWSGRRSFTCVARRQENPDVVSFVLQPGDDAPVGDVAPGQYVTVSLPHDGEVMPRRRCYSISAVPDAVSLRISVRRLGEDGISALLHDRVEVGDEVFLGPPAGRFVLESDPLRAIVLVSAGVGITPLLPMAEHLARENGDRAVWFVHAARNARHHLFENEVRHILDANPRIRLLTAYSRPEVGDVCHHRGRLDAKTLARYVPFAEADFYLCGPEAFMSSLSHGLIALGASPESIRTEKFEQKDAGLGFLLSGSSANRAPCTVTFARSSRRVEWKPESGSLLDLALANAVDAQYSCRSGECQSCMQRIVKGSVTYPSGDEPFLPRGQALLCQAIPNGNIVLDC